MEPGGELLDEEGRGEVVVGAEVEPLDAVGDLVQRCQDDDRRDAALAAQVAQKRDPPPVGKHQIQQDQIIGCAVEMLGGSVEAADPVHRMVVPEDMVAHRGSEDRVVLDQKNSHEGAIPSVRDLLPAEPVSFLKGRALHASATRQERLPSFRHVNADQGQMP